MATILQDLRYALRQLARNRVFAVVSVASLAIGIGVNTAVFSVVNAALLRPLPVRNPEDLVILTDPSASGGSTGLNTGERKLLSYPEFVRLRDQSTTMTGICATQASMNIWHLRIGDGQIEDVKARLVSENYFDVLGAVPALGRFFSQEDAKGAEQDPYAVISFDYWQRRFGGNVSVLGTPIRFRAGTLTVIGVAAQEFRGENMADHPDLWMPMMMQPVAIPGRDWLHEDLSERIDKVMWLQVFGRLKKGVDLARAQAEIGVLFRGALVAGYPATLAPELRRQALDQHLTVRKASTGAFADREEFSRQLLVLLGASIVVLAIACLNVANLLLARALARNKEVSIRLSVGASRARLVRQFLTESLVLAIAGGVSGLLLASGLTRLLTVFLSAARNNLELSSDLDGRLFAFTAAVTLFTGILFGLAPALRGTRPQLVQGLREGGQSTASRGGLAIGRSLSILQIGLCLLAVVLAGLLMRTLRNLQSVELGYPRENLVLVRVDGVAAGYQGPQLPPLWRELTARLQSLPGVKSASYSTNGLFSDAEADDEIEVEGFTARREDETYSNFDMTGPGYFSTVGIPLLRGRDFSLQDGSGAPHVCVINEAFAQVFFAGRDPIGRHITQKFGSLRNVMEVIGVARNARDHSLREAVPPRFYVPGDQGMQGPNQWAIFEIRALGNPEQMRDAVGKTILSVNGSLFPQNARPLSDLLERQTAHSRMIARLCAIFALVSLLQAATGLYGVLSYGVTRRLNEIGIRMAMGAGRSQVVAMILRETSGMIVTGSAIGIVLTLACRRLIAAWLYGLTALDPITIAAAVLTLSAIALIAAGLPAARASRISPTTALRRE
ncbi:MAG: ABC transporter permease [Acidobacteriia bacterium]|nr:ABC transporter permease [Terriglobia bacterium]